VVLLGGDLSDNLVGRKIRGAASIAASERRVDVVGVQQFLMEDKLSLLQTGSLTTAHAQVRKSRTLEAVSAFIILARYLPEAMG